MTMLSTSFSMGRVSRFLFLCVSAFALFACSSDDGSAKTPRGAKSAALRVEGYLAFRDSSAVDFSTTGTLIAKDQVNLSAETAGKLVTLYAKDGQWVSKGALLAKIDDSELRASLKSAVADEEYAQKREERTKTLYEKNGATAAELETADNALETATASRELIAAQLAKTEIRAPFSGKIGTVDVSEGAWMTTGSAFAVLTDVSELKVEFDIPQRYSENLKVGDEVIVEDSEQGNTSSATIRFMSPTISATSRTRKIRAIVKNPKGKFLSGGFVHVQLHLEGLSEKAIPVPTEAVTLDNEGAYLFVAKAGKAIKTRIETGLRTTITVDVKRGLNVGDTVIVSGLMSVRDGSDVQIKQIRNRMNYEVSE